MIKALALNSGDTHSVSDSATDFLRSLRLITKAEIHKRHEIFRISECPRLLLQPVGCERDLRRELHPTLRYMTKIHEMIHTLEVFLCLTLSGI